MSPTIKRYFGIVLVIAAAIIFILNLQRVANLGMNGLAVILLITGAIFISFSRKAKN